MRIAIDMAHPAHVHLFKHFIWDMQDKGHTCLITVAEKDIACDLLRNYDFDFINHGSYGRSVGRKIMNVPLLDYRLYRTARSFKPDLFIGNAAFRAAHIAFLLRKPSIIFDDTEIGKAEMMLYAPFATHICTPVCYKRNLGRKHLRYPGYHELAYLHPGRFTPNPDVLKKMALSEDDKFVIMRFVGRDAVHDIGHAGLGIETKKQAVDAFSQHASVFITSEHPLPDGLEPFRIGIPPEEIHHAMAYATLLYGESATMASECAVLGTPAIYLDNVGRGYTHEQEETYGLVFNFRVSPVDQQRSIEKGVEILINPGVKAEWQEKQARLLKDKVDVTQWLVDFVEKEYRYIRFGNQPHASTPRQF